MISSGATPGGRTLSALRHRNFRLCFAAQTVSNVGTWVQITVENWLVLQLSHSAVALGVTNALQFGPMLLLGLYGGVVADRCDRRRLLVATQAGLGVLAFSVGLLVALGIVQVWMIWLAAATLGVVKCFDLPALQGFVKDLVGPEDLPNAVAWTNATSAAGRMVGPVLGGLVLAGPGIAAGFAINAATFLLVAATLAKLDVRKLSPRMSVRRTPGQVRQGLAYIRADPVLATTSIVMIVVFVSAYNFQISLALIASETLGGEGKTYGTLMSALGLGALVGSLILARHTRHDLPMLLGCTAALSVTQFAVSVAQNLVLLLAVVFAYGVSAGLFSVTVSSRLQTQTLDDMRGRVMAFHSVCFLGSSLVGGPAFGAIAGWIGVSSALQAAAFLCAAVALAVLIVRQAKQRQDHFA